ncbi:MAG: acylphosphatase [Coriobacteriia bacterium]|nr:acylphosphatase [Coriobacteriia bacterium]
MATARTRVIIEGIVQGVFFRESTRRCAEEFGVSGWVRNLPDRRVEAVFEGEPEAVEGIVAWTHIGPVHASVEKIERFVEPAEGIVGFAVLD